MNVDFLCILNCSSYFRYSFVTTLQCTTADPWLMVFLWVKLPQNSSDSPYKYELILVEGGGCAYTDEETVLLRPGRSSKSSNNCRGPAHVIILVWEQKF